MMAARDVPACIPGTMDVPPDMERGSQIADEIEVVNSTYLKISSILGYPHGLM
jgi:hypothetical protein